MTVQTDVKSDGYLLGVELGFVGIGDRGLIDGEDGTGDSLLPKFGFLFGFLTDLELLPYFDSTAEK